MGGYADRVRPAAARRATAAWPRVGRTRWVSAHARAGPVVCVWAGGPAATLQVGARTERDLAAVEAALGAPLRRTHRFDLRPG